MGSLLQRTRLPFLIRDEAGVDARHEPAWIRRKMPHFHVWGWISGAPEQTRRDFPALERHVCAKELMKSILVVNGRYVCLTTSRTVRGWTNWPASKPIFETAKIRSNVSNMHNSIVLFFRPSQGDSSAARRQARRCARARGHSGRGAHSVTPNTHPTSTCFRYASGERTHAHKMWCAGESRGCRSLRA